MTDRRHFIAATLLAAPTYALLSALATPATVASSLADTRVTAWLRRQDEIARALADGAVSGAGWQQAVESLASEVDLDQLADAIARSRMRDLGRGLPSYPVKRSVRFLDADGDPRELRFAAALFEFDATNVITPHAHRHMASAHLILNGAFRVRTFDRVADEPGAILVRPTGDSELAAGAVSTMSGEHDNVHWFVPTTRRATTFDVIVSGLDEGAPNHVIEAIDPARGEERADGTIRAPLIGFHEAARFYTHDV